MKRFLCLLAWSVLLLGPCAVHAQTPDPFGTVVKEVAVDTESDIKLLADPTRDRIYGVVNSINSAVAIDLTTLQTTLIPVGPQPVDLAISPDGSTLYTANSGSMSAAVSVIDLNTLSAGPALALPMLPSAIAAGPGGRVYAIGPFGGMVHQLDTATGASVIAFPGQFAGPLKTSPDGNTLFVFEYLGSGTYTYPLETFDVSTATAMPLVTSAANNEVGYPVISNTGKYFCLLGEDLMSGSNFILPLRYTSDLTEGHGSFYSQTQLASVAFSPDDSLLYTLRYDNSGPRLGIFNTGTLLQTEETAPYQSPFPLGVGALILDRTGSYLFTGAYGNITGITTGVGTLTPPSILPTFTGDLYATGETDKPFTYQITTTGVPTNYVANGLPSGLTLNPTTGLISGKPTAGVGTTYVPITVSNSSGTVASLLAIALTAKGAPVITSPAGATGYVGVPLTFPLTATHGPVSFGIEGNFPPGLMFTSANSIGGTPTTVGTFYVFLTATNNAGSDTVTLTFNILPAPLPTVDIMATVPVVKENSGGAGEFTLSRTGDLSSELTVSYAIFGSAKNGKDYHRLSGTKTIKLNEASATIKVIPEGTQDTEKSTVKLALLSTAAYQVGEASKARVVIQPAD